jgi:hypothetical protein
MHAGCSVEAGAYVIWSVYVCSLGQEACNRDRVIAENSISDMTALGLRRDAKSLPECCEWIRHGVTDRQM